mgnify:CR=1 FL=1
MVKPRAAMFAAMQAAQKNLQALAAKVIGFAAMQAAQKRCRDQVAHAKAFAAMQAAQKFGDQLL